MEDTPLNPEAEALSAEDQAIREIVYTETRWQIAAAVIAIAMFSAFLPDSVRKAPAWVIPAIAALLLVALFVGDPRRLVRRRRTRRNIRRLSIAIVFVLVFAALWETAVLISQLIQGGEVANSASALLTGGATVWVSNMIAFALLYWEFDCGGPLARARELPQFPDLAFTQQINPDLTPPGWRPRFIDYLYLSYTNSTALSPTDVMPLVPWAKIAMALQSAISLVIIGLVIARAVNEFS
jgi:hypothetical protein